MSTTCPISKCSNDSYGVCNCCQQKICRYHLKAHRDLQISKVKPLIEQIGILENRIKDLDVENMISNARQTLEEWRLDCYKKIDQFIEEKCYQLTQYVIHKIDDHRTHINQMRSKLTQLLNKEEMITRYLNSAKSKLEELKNEVTKTEQTTFNIQIQSLVTSDDLIRIKESNPYEFELASLSTPYKTIETSKKNWVASATNENYLLIYKESNLCLVDQEFTIIKSTPWSFGEIWDIIWSSVLEKFIVINQKNVFLVDEKTMSITNTSITTKTMWCCGTCSNQSLFLATYKRGASIVVFDLLPSIEFAKHWKSPETCSQDEGIHDISYNDDKILMVIENQVKKTVRVDLRSVKTLNCLWSFRLDSAENLNVQIRSCLFNRDEWIIVYHDLSCLLHITNDGKLKTSSSYSPPPHFASRFGSNLFVVTTSNSINLHKIQF